MALSRRLVWFLLIATILTAGTLRQFHERTPSSPFLPWPVRSLLFFLVLILFLAFARGWGGRQEIPYAGAGLRRVNFLAFLPLLIALTLEKWISITFYGPLFYRLNGESLRPLTFEALYILESAAGLLVVSLMLLPLFRRLAPMLRTFFAPSGIAVAAAGTGASLACVFGGLLLLLRLAGAGGVHLEWRGFGDPLLVLGGQALISFSEEFYYRGILQTELSFLLPSLGVTGARARRLTAVFLISMAFALEHLVWGDTYSDSSRRLLFTFGCSFFLGILLALLGNLYLNAACHFVLNIFSLGLDVPGAGAGLRFVDERGRSFFEPSLYICLFLVFLFVFAYLWIAIGSRQESARHAGAAAVR